MRERIGIGLVLLLTVLSTGCQRQTPTPTATPSGTGRKARPTETLQPSRQYVIALIMKTMTNEFFQTMQEGAQAEADRLGVTLEPYAGQSEQSAGEQADIIATCVTKQVDAILIAPADSKAVVAPLLEANRAGIAVLNLDNRIDRQTAEQAGLELVTFIGPDNEEGAEKACDYLFEQMGGKGSVAMLEGKPEADNARARKAGFEKAAAKHPGIKVVISQSAHWALEEGERVFANMLTAHPETNGLFCANDMMALGAIRAIAAAGKTGDILVASYDNLAEAQKQILEGTVLCTIEQHPAWMGRDGVKSAVEYLEGREVPSEVAIETELITKATLEQTEAAAADQ